jgi:hypothetical protein
MKKGRLIQAPAAKEQVYHFYFGAGSGKKPVEIRL